MRFWKQSLPCLLFAAAVAAGDQLFKHWLVQRLALHEQLPVFPGVLHLTRTHNTGAAFSMLNSVPWLLTAVSAVAVVLLLAYLLRWCRLGMVGRLAMAGVLGGAVGNLIDRITAGYVVDMFEVEFVRFAVFNVADCFITVGGIVFCICFIVEYGRGDRTLRARPMPELERLKSGAAGPAAAEKTEQKEHED